MMRCEPLALDLASYRKQLAQDSNSARAWITPYHRYRFISYDLASAVASVAESVSGEPGVTICLRAKLGDILLDLARLCRAAVELQTFMEHAERPKFDPTVSPYHAFLADPARTPLNLVEPVLNRSATTRVIAHLKILKRRFERIARTWRPGNQHLDILAPNALLDEYLTAESIRATPLYAYHHRWPTPSTNTTVMGDAISALMGSIASSLPDDLMYNTRLLEGVRQSITSHLERAHADYRFILRRQLPHRMGRSLIGGTPKYLGRLISAIYAGEGRPVLRFAHGGERGLYSDFAWGLVELPYCSHYFVHGRGEATLIEQRLKSDLFPTLGTQTTHIQTRGSKRHQRILDAAYRQRHQPSGKTLMYVSTGFVAEHSGYFPASRPHNVMSYEFHRWLLGLLRERGYRVAVKMHPKGLYSDGTLFDGICDEIVTGYFDPSRHRADCYLFDYAGSAFMDSLSHAAAVVLLDYGVRPLDPQALTLLETRVKRVLCSSDENNRFRVDPDELIDAIETARDGDCLAQASTFVRQYFSA